MVALDLTQALKGYKDGWVAIDEKNYEVVAHAENYEKIEEKVKDRNDILLMPASDNYFGFIT